ncbi:MAG: hypothetical protein ACYSTT_11225, partial [Planctomycetota bacterium]
MMKATSFLIILSLLLTVPCFAKLPDITAAEILKAWEDNYTHFEIMKVSYTERVLEAVPPVGNPNKFDSLVRLMHVERVEQGQRFHIRYSCDEEGLKKP